MTISGIDVLADFNAEPLARILRQLRPDLDVQVTWDTNAQVAIQNVSSVADSDRILCVWISPDRSLPAVRRITLGESVEESELTFECQKLAEMLRQRLVPYRHVVWVDWMYTGNTVNCWTDRGDRRGVGFNVRNAIDLVEKSLVVSDKVITLSPIKWIFGLNCAAISDRSWYSIRCPFSLELLRSAAYEIVHAYRCLDGQVTKIVITDLDNTLWGGEVGELDSSEIRLGVGTPEGEAFRDFQTELKRLSRLGVQLAIASKNEEVVAFNALKNLPEMILKLDDFAAWRVNWLPKSRNIAEMLEELNFSQASAVFLDDSAFERGSVRKNLPDVMVPELPNSPLARPQFLKQLRLADSRSVTEADISRTRQYVSDRHRRQFHKKTDGEMSESEFLHELHIEVDSRLMSLQDCDRVEQLFQRTNQFTATARRIRAEELKNLMTVPESSVIVSRARDRFGDLGLISAIVLSFAGNGLEITDWAMSCRSFGRGIEDAVLADISSVAQKVGATVLHVRPISTGRNRLFLEFIETRGFTMDENGSASKRILEAQLGRPSHIAGSWPETIQSTP